MRNSNRRVNVLRYTQSDENQILHISSCADPENVSEGSPEGYLAGGLFFGKFIEFEIGEIGPDPDTPPPLRSAHAVIKSIVHFKRRTKQYGCVSYLLIVIIVSNVREKPNFIIIDHLHVLLDQ